MNFNHHHHDEDHRELVRLATIQRNAGEEIRWTLEEFDSRHSAPVRYVEARKWKLDDRGQMKPTQSAVTIRLHEIQDVVLALQRATRHR